jgi:hypothetical protein
MNYILRSTLTSSQAITLVDQVGSVLVESLNSFATNPVIIALERNDHKSHKNQAVIEAARTQFLAALNDAVEAVNMLKALRMDLVQQNPEPAKATLTEIPEPTDAALSALFDAIQHDDMSV